MNYRECYQNGMLRLQKAEVPEPDMDARLLLEYICGTDRNTLLVHGDMPVEEEKRTQYFALIEKRESRVPLQQLTGEQCFCGLDFKVNEHVLIPRQDTEVLVEEVLKYLKPGNKLLDMCTGSGCILISLMALGKEIQGTGVDVSEEALQVAVENGRRLLPKENQPEWFLGDLFSAFSEEKGESLLSRQFDVIVSNPPYICSSVIETLQSEVKEHEPRLALDGSEDGLVFYRKIVKDSVRFLKPEGMLFFEIGYDQGEDVKKLMESYGFSRVEIKKDYAGLDRVVFGKKS